MKSRGVLFLSLKTLYPRNKHIELLIFLHISKVFYVKLIKILLPRKANYNKIVEPGSLNHVRFGRNTSRWLDGKRKQQQTLLWFI